MMSVRSVVPMTVAKVRLDSVGTAVQGINSRGIPQFNMSRPYFYAIDWSEYGGTGSSEFYWLEKAIDWPEPRTCIMRYAWLHKSLKVPTRVALLFIFYSVVGTLGSATRPYRRRGVNIFQL